MIEIVVFILQLIGFNHDRLLNGSSQDTLNKQQSNTSCVKSVSSSQSDKSRKIPNSVQILDVQEVELPKSPIEVKILYESNKPNSQNTLINTLKITNTDTSSSTCDKNCTTNECLTKGQTLLTSYFRPIERNSNHSTIDDSAKEGGGGGGADLYNDDWNDSDNALQIDYAPANDLTFDSGQTNKKCLLFHRKRIRRKYKHISTLRQRSINLLLLIQNNFTVDWPQFKNKNVLWMCQCLIKFHRITCELVKNNQPNGTIANEDIVNMTTEPITINRRAQKETSDDATAAAITATNHNNDGAAKRLPKNQRSSDNSRLLLLTENAHESSEKDFGMYLFEGFSLN